MHKHYIHMSLQEAEKKSKAVQKKIDARAATAAIDPLLNDQFNAGRLYAVIASRPGQSGRCDGYILEGKELEFYIRKIKVCHKTFFILS